VECQKQTAKNWHGSSNQFSCHVLSSVQWIFLLHGNFLFHAPVMAVTRISNSFVALRFEIAFAGALDSPQNPLLNRFIVVC
jgi:hypothetical protein